jgi:hypothetical protein
MTRSTNEKRTRTPSIIFHPDLRYVFGPTIRPSDITLEKNYKKKIQDNCTQDILFNFHATNATDIPTQYSCLADSEFIA